MRLSILEDGQCAYIVAYIIWLDFKDFASKIKEEYMGRDVCSIYDIECRSKTRTVTYMDEIGFKIYITKTQLMMCMS